MLIKRITTKGVAVPFTAEEAIGHAVGRAIRLKNTKEIVYWIDKRSISVSSFNATVVDKNGDWEAWVAGTVNVGTTVGATGKFHDPKPYQYNVHYKTGKDDLGISDIIVLEDSTIEPMVTNPSELVADIKLPKAPVLNTKAPKTAPKEVTAED